MTERLTIIDFVEKYVAKYSQNPFLWEKNLDTNVWEPTTYEETLRKAKRIAAGLMTLGVQKGEKISYLSEGRDMWVIGELGVLYAGAVNVPLSIKLEESNDLVFRVKHSDSKYIITSKFQLPKIRKILPECPMVEKVIIFDEVADKKENEIFIDEIIDILAEAASCIGCVATITLLAVVRDSVHRVPELIHPGGNGIYSLDCVLVGVFLYQIVASFLICAFFGIG